MVIDAKSEGTIILSNQKNREREGALTPLNDTLVQHILNLFFDLIFLKIRISVRSDVNLIGVRQKVDPMVKLADRRQPGGKLENCRVICEDSRDSRR